MKTEEIKSEDWSEFCNRFSETNRGSLLTIEVIGRDGIRSEIASDEPLDKITFDRTDACNDVISISLGLPGEKKRHHFAVDPTYVLIRKEAAGAKILELRAENGTTLITFHSGRFPQLELEAHSDRERR